MANLQNTSQIQSGYIGPDSEKEQGIQEEGVFDALKPFKRALLEKIKESVPDEETGNYIKEAGQWLLPDSPIPLIAAGVTGLSPKLQQIIQKVRFPQQNTEGQKVFKTLQSATREAFNAMPQEVQAIKRSQALENIVGKGMPPVATAAKAATAAEAAEAGTAAATAPAWKPPAEYTIEYQNNPVKQAPPLDYGKMKQKPKPAQDQ